MRIHNKTTGTSGIVSGWEEAVRFRDMIIPEAEERVRILTFWKKHGSKIRRKRVIPKLRTMEVNSRIILKRGATTRMLSIFILIRVHPK